MSSTALIIILVIVTIIAFFWFSARRIKNMPMVPSNEHIVTLTSANFQNQLKSGVSLVDFWADWCMPCRMMSPILNDVAEEAKGKAKICKLDIQQYQDIAGKMGVRSIPTLILFKNGKEVNRFVGVKTKDFLLKEIDRVR